MRTFTQPAPPDPDFIDIRFEGYTQLPVAPGVLASAPQGLGVGDEWTEEFRFLRHAPFTAIGAVVASFSMNQDSQQLMLHQLDISKFFLRAVHPDDRQRLVALLDDQRRVITAEQLAGAAMYLVEQYSGKASTTPPTS